MNGPSPTTLLSRFAALPAAAALLDALGTCEDVYLVGGAVRDLLRNAEPVDLDLVVDGDLEGLAALLGAPARVNERFGTVTLNVGVTRLDLARARRERYARPGALPDVEPASLDEDLRRRDFTVNALAMALGGARRGELSSVPGALADIEAGALRVLHDESFRDDPTRLLRMARYAGRLGFEPEARTLILAGEAMTAGSLDTVSTERLGAELRLIVAEENPVAALAELRRLGLDQALVRGLQVPEAPFVGQALALLPAEGDPAVLVLAAAALDVVPAELAGRLAELSFPAAQRERILAAAGRARILAGELAAARLPSAIAAAANGAPVELVALAGALGPVLVADRWLSQLRHVTLEIDGSDLLAAGVAPGPALGAGLRAALAGKRDGRLHGRSEELAAALRVAGAGG